MLNSITKWLDNKVFCRVEKGSLGDTLLDIVAPVLGLFLGNASDNNDDKDTISTARNKTLNDQPSQ